MSQILNGKIKITFQMAKKISQQLKFSKTESEYFLSLVNGAADYREMTLNPEILKNGISSLDFAILSLMETIDFKFDYQWIAERLEASQEKVKNSMGKLISNNLIKTEGDLPRPNYDIIKTASLFPEENIRKFHQRNLQDLSDKIIKTDFNDRDSL